MTARIAIWRWAWRLIRTEWRQQTLIIGLVIAAVALSVSGGLLAYHAAPSDDAINTGTLFTLEGDQAQIDRLITAAGDDVGTLQRGEAQVPGAFGGVPVRTLDPTHPRTAPLVDLLSGAFPSGPAQVAVTDGAAAFLAASVGDSIELGGNPVTIVGLVENPTDLSDEFAFLDHANPTPIELQTQYTTSLSMEEIVGDSEQDLSVGSSETGSIRSQTTILTTVVMTIAMMLVGLIVSSAFGVVARRRVRQYGLLGAIGAQERSLRSAAAFNGFAVGAISAAIGAVLGIAAAAAILPFLESALGQRIDFVVQPFVVTSAVLVAVVMSTVASWWPARAMARQPIVEALAARRPQRLPVRNTTMVGAITAAIGFVLLFTSTSPEGPTLPAVGGIVLVIVGVLLLTPLMVGLMGPIAARFALPVRIAGRDLVRFQGRAAAALAAVVLALAIPTGIGLVTASYDARAQVEPTNLADNTAIVWAEDIVNDGDMLLPVALNDAALETSMATIAAELPSLSVTPIETIADPTDTVTWDDGTERQGTARVYFEGDAFADGSVSCWGNDQGDFCFEVVSAWVASPALTTLFGVEAPAAGVDFLTSRTDALLVEDPARAEDRSYNHPLVATTTAVVALPDYQSYPDVLIAEHAVTPEADRKTIGWIVSSPEAITPAEVETMRSAMVGGTEVETISNPQPQTSTRTVAAAIGMLIGLAVLGATVTLIRSESADDAHTLNVLGAPARVRRSVAGATAAMVAFGGALLAIPIGFIGLVIIRTFERNLPIAIPWATVGVLLLVFPVVAALFSGMFSGGLKEAT